MAQTPNSREGVTVELCPECDGRGHDNDLFWPRHCYRCDGTGIDPDDGEYPEDDGDEDQWATAERMLLGLTAEQPVGKFWCESCDGTGKIDERLTAYSDSNPAAECPDCDGNGWWQSARAPVTAEQGGADDGRQQSLWVHDLGGPTETIHDKREAFGENDEWTEFRRAALTTQPQAEPPWDFGTWRARLMELVHQYDTVRDGTPSKAEAYDALWKHAGNIGDHWKARQFLAERESAQPQAEPADARIYWHASQGWQVEWLTTAPNGGQNNYYRRATPPSEAT